MPNWSNTFVTPNKLPGIPGSSKSTVEAAGPYDICYSPSQMIFRILFLRCVAGFVGCGWCLAAITANAASPTYTQVVAQFEAISFSTEFGHEERRGIFFRWPATKPVYIRTIGNTHPGLEAVLVELRELTGLQFVPTPLHELDRIVIRYRPQTECRGRGDNNLISVTIATGSTQTIRHCHLEELVQSVGPSDDACRYRPSIFCDGDYFLQDYTPADRIIIRATFDPRLPDFGEQVHVMPIARQVIRELYEKEFGPIRDEDEHGDQPAPDTEELSLP